MAPVRLVVDTNVALKAYLEEDLAEESQETLDAARDGTAVLLAPDLILLEFRHALDKRSRRGELSPAEAREIWEAFGGYPLSLFEVGPLVPRAAEIVDRTGCTVYDAVFVALAESEGTVVLTADGRLLRALEGTLFAGLLRPLVEVGEVLRRST